MKFAAIAALLATAQAAGTIAAGAACTKYDDCTGTNKCGKVTKASGNTDGTLEQVCYPEAGCSTKAEVQGSDSKAYESKVESCLSKPASSDGADGTVDLGEACEKSVQCRTDYTLASVQTDLACGAIGDSKDTKCVVKATCNVGIGSLTMNCEGAMRNALVMAVAALAVAYSL